MSMHAVYERIVLARLSANQSRVLNCESALRYICLQRTSSNMPFSMDPNVAKLSEKKPRTIDINTLDILPEKKARKMDRTEAHDLPNPNRFVLQMDWTCSEWFCVAAIAHEMPTRKPECSNGVLFNQVCFSDVDESKRLRLAQLSYAQGKFDEGQPYQLPFKWAAVGIKLNESRVAKGHEKVYKVNPKIAQECAIEKHPQRMSKDALLLMLSDLKKTTDRNGRLCIYDMELEGGIIRTELECLGEDTSRWDAACKNGLCLMDSNLSNWAFGSSRKFAFVAARELFEHLLGRQAAFSDPGNSASKCWQVLRKMYLRVRQHVKMNAAEPLGTNRGDDTPNSQQTGDAPRAYHTTAKAIPPTLAARKHFAAVTSRYMAIFVEVHIPFGRGRSEWRPGQFGFDVKVPEEDMQTMRASRIAWARGDVTSACPQIKSCIVRPDGFRIVDGQPSLRRISNAEAMQNGTPLKGILDELLNDILAEHEKGARVCAHQIEHNRPPAVQNLSSCVCVCLCVIRTAPARSHLFLILIYDVYRMLDCESV